MTSRVQMLDVGLNKPFKSQMLNFQRQFICDQDDENIVKPKITRELMTKWIADSWESIGVAVIQNTARSIGFVDPV